MSTDKVIEALLAVQEHRELKQEHFRQIDLGWANSPGFGDVNYQTVVNARNKATKLIAEALGIETDYCPHRPDLAPEFTKGRKKPIIKANYWIVQRRYLNEKSPLTDIGMIHG